MFGFKYIDKALRFITGLFSNTFSVIDNTTGMVAEQVSAARFTQLKELETELKDFEKEIPKLRTFSASLMGSFQDPVPNTGKAKA